MGGKQDAAGGSAGFDTSGYLVGHAGFTHRRNGKLARGEHVGHRRYRS